MANLTRHRRHRRPTRGQLESGETLVEILVTLTIVSIAVATLVGGLMTSTMTSATHRNITTLDGVLRSFVESARNAIETQPSNGSSGPQFTPCATPSSYTVVANPNPGSGVVGSSVTVFGTGSGLSAGSRTVTFAATSGGTTGSSTASVLAGPDGAPSGASSTFTVPPLPHGTYTVTPFGSSVTAAAATFTVTPWIGAIAPLAAGSVGPGTKVTFPVTGFAAGSDLTVSIAGTTIDTGVITSATGSASDSFTIPSSLSSAQIASVTVSDAAGNAAPSVRLQVGTDTATADDLPASSPFKYYTLASSIQYWNGTGFDRTTACSTSPDQKLQDITYTLYDSETGSAASDALDMVVGDFGPVTSTSTVLASSANPSVVGQGVTYTATVSVVSPGTGSPPTTDTVDFEDSGTSISGCSAVPVDAAGVATCTTTYNSVGSHLVSATFSGDTSFSGSTSNTIAQTVKQASTTTTLTSSANPSVSGQSVTLTATVTVSSPGSGMVSGSDTVNFTDGGTSIAGCSAVSTVSGVATCNTTFATATVHGLTATSSGDTNFAGSSGALTETVNKAATSTALASSANPSVVDQAVTYTATVTITSPGGGTPSSSATVKFSDGATAIAGCTAQTVSWPSGQATCTVTYNSLGGHSVVAVFSGDTNYSGSTSPTVSQTVNQSPTTTSLTSSANPVGIGQVVTYTATVAGSTPGSGTPSTADKVTFTDNGTPIAGCANLAVNASGQAQCQVTYSATGTHPIVATSTGDTNYQGSTSSTLSESVVTAVVFSTSTKITSSVNPVGHTGQASVTYTATVTANPGGGSPPNTYTVTFTDGNSPIAGCANLNLSSGAVSCTTSYKGNQTGNHTITAIFNGDATYTGSSGSLTETVQ